MELEAQQLSLFDYATLDTDTRLFVQEKTARLHELDAREEEVAKQHADIIIEKGLLFLQVKEELREKYGTGRFLAWLASEGKTAASADQYMKVSKVFGADSYRGMNYPFRILREIAYASSPDTILEMIKTEQIPATLPAIREAKRELHQPVITPTLTEHDAALSGYRGYDRWQEEKWEERRQKAEKSIPPAPVYTPPTQYTPPALSVVPTESIDEDIDDEDEEYEETEEDRFETAAAIGTLDYYYADLRREAILRDEEEREKRRGAPAALQMSESNEWYTPGRYIEAARTLMDGIDLDPASNALANETIQAATYYDIETNGLDKDWAGRVWLNPPYGREGGDSNQEIWSHRLIEQFQSGITTEAVLLVNANTEAKWFQPLYDYLICFTNHRIRFYNTEGTSSQPTQGNALIYFGPQKARFTELFKQFGPIVRRIA